MAADYPLLGVSSNSRSLFTGLTFYPAFALPFEANTSCSITSIIHFVLVFVIKVERSILKFHINNTKTVFPCQKILQILYKQKKDGRKAIHQKKQNKK